MGKGYNCVKHHSISQRRITHLQTCLSISYHSWLTGTLGGGGGNRPLSLHRAPDTTLPQHNNRNRPSEEPMTCRGATEGGEKSKCQHFLPVAKPPSFRSRRRCRIASSSSVDDSTATTLATCLGGRGVSVCWFLCWQCVSFLTLSLPLGRSMRSVAKKY